MAVAQVAMRATMLPRRVASTIDVGSSATTSRGRPTRAPARTTRWRCPPES